MLVNLGRTFTTLWHRDVPMPWSAPHKSLWFNWSCVGYLQESVRHIKVWQSLIWVKTIVRHSAETRPVAVRSVCTSEIPSPCLAHLAPARLVPLPATGIVRLTNLANAGALFLSKDRHVTRLAQWKSALRFLKNSSKRCSFFPLEIELQGQCKSLTSFCHH